MKTVFLYTLILRVGFIFALQAEEDSMCGYSYFPGAGWLKLHAENKTWQTAFDTCAKERANLADLTYPEVANLLHEYVVSHKIKIHTGVDPNVDPARPLKWHETYILDEDAVYQIGSKRDSHQFICHSVEGDVKAIHPCGSEDNSYHYDARTKKCYKFHPYSKMYDDAVDTCLREGGLLVIINSEIEAQVVRELFANNTPESIHGFKEDDNAVWRDIAFVGIFKMRGHWWTLPGSPIESTGYVEFAPGEPNNEWERCLSIDRSAKYYDDPCERPMPFICEVDPVECRPWWW